MSRQPLARIVLCLLVATSLSTGPADARPQADLDEPLDLELREASLHETYEVLAALAGVSLDMPPELEGRVTVSLHQVPWRHTVEQICSIQDLACFLSQGDEPSLHVRPSAGFTGLAQPISLSLRGADLMAVLDAFDALTGDDFTVVRDERWEADVSLEFHAIPWHLALEHLCDLAGCDLAWSRDHVVVTQGDEEKTTETEPGAGLESHPQLVAFDRVEIVMHDGVVRNLPEPGAVPDFATHSSYVEALDAFCTEAACEWRLEWDDPAVLRLWPRGSSPGARGGGRTPTPRIGALPFHGLPPLALRVAVGGAGGASEDVELSWSRPRHSLGVVHTRDGAPGEPGVLEGATFVHLAWIPFAPDRQVLLPLGLSCGPAGRRAEAFDPLPLPLAAPWTREVDGIRLQIRPLGRPGEATASEAESSEAERSTKPSETGTIRTKVRGRSLMEALCSFPISTVEIRLLPRAASGATEDVTPLRTQILEGQTPGSYLLVSPARAGDADAPAIALVLLGPDDAGHTRLSLVRPDGPELREFVLAPGETHLETLGSEYGLLLRVAGDASGR